MCRLPTLGQYFAPISTSLPIFYLSAYPEFLRYGPEINYNAVVRVYETGTRYKRIALYSETTVLPLMVKTLGVYGHVISRYQVTEQLVLSNLPWSKNGPAGYNFPVSSGSGWLLLSGTVL